MIKNNVMLLKHDNLLHIHTHTYTYHIYILIFPRYKAFYVLLITRNKLIVSILKPYRGSLSSDHHPFHQDKNIGSYHVRSYRERNVHKDSSSIRRHPCTLPQDFRRIRRDIRTYARLVHSRIAHLFRKHPRTCIRQYRYTR